MAKKPLCIAFLWHMHQPDYGNEETGEIYLPWTRFHAVKDYYDMGALAAQVPGIHITINVVPSMMDQLEAYAQGSARETYAALTLRKATELDEREKSFLLRSFFQLPWKQMILPYPRYKELLDRRGSPDAQGEYSAALKRYSSQDYRDLQVWFNLSWCGNELRRDPAIAAMLHKGRDFTEEEKVHLLDLQAAFIGRILPLYRKLLEEHGVEISVSPYYHPILPLLFDSRSAREATPDITLPANQFSCPADAREHVARAQGRFREVFGQAPRGMWPSEGSISDAASALAQEAGLRWLASDEGVLLNSLRKSGHGGGALTPEQRCCVWSRAGGPALFFRDHALSDLIGFTYGRWNTDEAVGDFLQRLRLIHDALPDDGRHYVVPVILDGENAWEHYPRNGAEFLALLYRRMMEADFLRTVTFSEFLDLEAHREPLDTIAAGSWIYSCLTTWIGHPEKNAAWDALTAARQAFARLEREITDTRQRDRALQEVMIAEGSDWFWWYGDDFVTENAPEFDALFRRNVEQVFRRAGLTAPERLARPIIAPHKDKSQASAISVAPRRLIHPQIDGYSRSYFEWNGAGFHRPGGAGGSSMYQGGGAFSQLWYGFSLSDLYIRLDPAQGADTSGELRILLTRDKQERTLRMQVRPGEECPVVDERGTQCGAGRAGTIVELAVSVSALGLSPADRAGLLLRLLRNGIEVDRLPHYGEVELVVPDQSFEQRHWYV